MQANTAHLSGNLCTGSSRVDLEYCKDVSLSSLEVLIVRAVILWQDEGVPGAVQCEGVQNLLCWCIDILHPQSVLQERSEFKNRGMADVLRLSVSGRQHEHCTHVPTRYTFNRRQEHLAQSCG